MKKPRRQVQRGLMLQRVRHLQERVAQKEVHEAQQAAEAKEREETRCRQVLDHLEQEWMDHAQNGVSATDFLRFQSLRQLHADAVVVAQHRRQQAGVEAKDCRDRFETAVQRRRQAERLVEVARTRLSLSQRRVEQKRSDDVNCARAGKASVL